MRIISSSKRIISRFQSIFIFSACVFLIMLVFFSDPVKVHIVRIVKDASNYNMLLAEEIADTKVTTLQESKTSKKWIVVTSISLPTEQLQRLSTIPGFKLLVVADLKTPSNWSHPGVTFLSVEKQLRLNYKILRHVPWNSYTRKMIGYLYAIEKGAEFIYDTDDDNAPDDPNKFESNFVFIKETSGLIPESNRLFNPYAHFGQPDIWPRGYPLEEIGANNSKWYTACRMKTPSIQQGLVNGDPDVDAVYRLVKKKHYKNLDITFDPVAPPVVYNVGTYSPYNSQNTLFHYEAFWSLMLPVTVAFRVTDIWRSYWAQPLQWKSGNFISFLAAHTTQRRNAHNYLKDFVEEDQLYKHSGKLVDFLQDWGGMNCVNETFDFCMVKLSKDMTDAGFWGEQDYQLTKAWVQDLERVGYRMPLVQPRNDTTSPCVDLNTRSNVRFEGVSIKEVNDLPSFPWSSYDVLQDFCNNTLPPKPPTSNFLMTHGGFNRTLLIVTYNFPHYENIYLLDKLYRPFFPNMLYCGDAQNGTKQIDGVLESKEFQESGVSSFSFLISAVENGYLAYSCILQAIDINYDVDDYVVMSDDVMLRFQGLVDLPKDSIWHFGKSPSILHMEKFGMEGNPQSWSWWESVMGRNATKAAIQEIEELARGKSAWAERFLETRTSSGYNSSVTRYGSGDFLRIPKSKLNVFMEASKIFLKHRVFLEIAVPLAISGADGNASKVPGTWLWGAQRNDPFMYFDLYKGVAFHPMKFNEILKNGKLREEYCLYFLADVVIS